MDETQEWEVLQKEGQKLVQRDRSKDNGKKKNETQAKVISERIYD